MTRRPIRIAAGLVLALGLSLSACSSDTETLADPAATGRELATEFLTILQSGDHDALADFLADGFQIQRADGSGANRDEYLAAPATVDTFELGDEVTAVQQGDLLTVRWSVVIDESTNGQQLGSDEAPRLSVFVHEDGEWKLLAHANFNRPA
ncbi:MAG: nuclear transport factor 2 family protein [Ilumatobacteraceae bacterium]